MFFNKKIKQYFIPMSFKIIGITIKSSSNLTEMVGFFESFNMKEVKAIGGFDT